MEWLNYHHLLYFWVVAKEGSVSRASETLRLSQPTVSGQIHKLEEALGEDLFTRKGRGLELTDMGLLVLGYAEEIFTLGRELQETLKGRPSGRPSRLTVGVSDVLPKLLVKRLLEPAFRGPDPVQLVCREAKTQSLLAELSTSGLDLVLADEPIAGGAKVRAFNHLLGECGVSFMAAPTLTKKYRGTFPKQLDGAPFLFPSEGTTLRRALDHWFEDQEVRPVVVAEFEDSALLKVFAADGEGIFVVPQVVEDEVAEHYGVSVLGRTDAIKERFFAISVERRIKHAAVAAISDHAKSTIFRA